MRCRSIRRANRCSWRAPGRLSTCCVIGTSEAGLVATGIQGFWVRAVVGVVFLAAVVFDLTMNQPQRLARLRQIVRIGW
jgi:simple sugar transport system permease protein